MNTPDTTDALARAREVLDGLSVGDAIGEALSYQFHRCRELSDFSMFRPGSVRYTDDTEMATALFETLERIGGVDEDVLAWAYASRYRRDPDRGYGRMARRILEEISGGAFWEAVSMSAFGGGSFGNGAAMRVAPLGAYFAHEPGRIPEFAARSARVTHYHREGIAGAIAVAVATAAAVRAKGEAIPDAAGAIWDAVMDFTPQSEVRARLEAVMDLLHASPLDVALQVGNGAEISAQDTVPFCVWSACRNIGDYREALLGTIEVGGDCDTNAAIVGGIVTGYTGVDAIPSDWLNAREKLGLQC